MPGDTPDPAPGNAAPPLSEESRSIDNGDLASDVAARFSLGSGVSISLEYGCPPPGILACGPGLRIRTKVNGQTSPALIRDFGNLATGFLGDAGIEDLEIDRQSPDGSSGQITRAGNSFLRWKRDSGVLEAVVGDLELRPDEDVSPRGGRSSGDEPARAYDVEVDSEILERFLDSLGLPGTG